MTNTCNKKTIEIQILKNPAMRASSLHINIGLKMLLKSLASQHCLFYLTSRCLSSGCKFVYRIFGGLLPFREGLGVGGN